MDGLPQHRGMLKGYVMGAFACTAMLMAPSSAAAATALGETNNPFTGVDCTGPSTYLQVSTGREPSYTAPANGVITSWRTFAAAGGAQVKLGVFRGSADNSVHNRRGQRHANAEGGIAQCLLNQHPSTCRRHAWAADRHRGPQLRHDRHRKSAGPH